MKRVLLVPLALAFLAALLGSPAPPSRPRGRTRCGDEDVDGTIKVELFADKSPVTVKKTSSPTWTPSTRNGLTFHRVISDFMIQAAASRRGSPPSQTDTGELSQRRRPIS